ncbi:RhuM family protein [Paenibacillus germinis]|uniref:RhuM family protein n=1 Tax=Paenibacillus germinis TaxID=2654979 RepID=UPI001FE641F7|nr:RhuM family protein [Paenibacillus germinis]
MKDWIDKLNSFLKFNEREILTNAGSISQDIAEKLATSEYEKCNKRRQVTGKVSVRAGSVAFFICLLDRGV